jgi:hypothetical protein
VLIARLDCAYLEGLGEGSGTHLYRFAAALSMILLPYLTFFGSGFVLDIQKSWNVSFLLESLEGPRLDRSFGIIQRQLSFLRSLEDRFQVEFSRHEDGYFDIGTA